MHQGKGKLTLELTDTTGEQHYKFTCEKLSVQSCNTKDGILEFKATVGEVLPIGTGQHTGTASFEDSAYAVNLLLKEVSDAVVEDEIKQTLLFDVTVSRDMSNPQVGKNGCTEIILNDPIFEKAGYIAPLVQDVIDANQPEQLSIEQHLDNICKPADTGAEELPTEEEPAAGLPAVDGIGVPGLFVVKQDNESLEEYSERRQKLIDQYEEQKAAD